MTEWQPFRACRVRGFLFPCPANADVAITRFYGQSWRHGSRNTELIWRDNPTDVKISNALLSLYSGNVERMARPALPPPECIVSEWNRSECSMPCLRGVRRLTRRVLQPDNAQSQSCPGPMSKLLTRKLLCNPARCQLETQPVRVAVSQPGPLFDQNLTAATALGSHDIKIEARNGIPQVELTHPDKDAQITFTLYATRRPQPIPNDANYPATCSDDGSAQRCSDDGRWYDCGCSKCTLETRCLSNELYHCGCPIEFPDPYQPIVLRKSVIDRIEKLPRRTFDCEHRYKKTLILSSQPNRYYLSACVIVPQMTDQTCGMWSLTSIEVIGQYECTGEDIRDRLIDASTGYLPGV